MSWSRDDGRQAPGVTAAERHLLRAGPLEAVLEDGGLRWITWQGGEVLRGIYAAVRDRAWRTIEPELLDLAIADRGGGFEVTFRAVHDDGDAAFEWSGRITGDDRGAVVFSFDGAARRTFLRNRIGFCVLHPLGVAGHPLSVVTPAGRVDGTFPDRIAPRNPFADIVGLDWSVMPGLDASIRFDGDIFEMEDQRNWTDASYKTFCTPSHLPLPVRIEAGTRVRQTVHLTCQGAGSRPHRPPGASVRVSSDVLARLPAVGFAIPPDAPAIDDDAVEHLAVLRPDHLHVSVTPGAPRWTADLAAAAAMARRIDAALEIEAIVADDGQGASELMAALEDLADVDIARVLLFSHGSFASTQPVIAAGRKALADLGRTWSIGGGSRANFLEFNDATLPLATLDVAGYAINPQVHAVDEASIVETLEAQAMTIRDARERCDPVPLAIGPVTLKPRFNAAIAPGDLDQQPAGALPDRVDARQASLFAAAWTVGCLASLGRPGVDALTFYETTGMAGLMLTRRDVIHPAFGDPGVGLFPLYHVFAAFRLAEHPKIVVSESSPTVAVVGLLAGSHLRVLVANLAEFAQTVGIDLPAGALARQVRVLDETSVAKARLEHDALARLGARGLRGGREIDLRPWAVARIDAQLPRSP